MSLCLKLAVTLGCFSLMSHGVIASEPDYRTTVDFIIKHGSGGQNGRIATVGEVSHCTLRFGSTSFHTKNANNTSSWSFIVDYDRPLSTTTFHIPFDGVMAERLVQPEGLGNPPIFSGVFW